MCKEEAMRHQTEKTVLQTGHAAVRIQKPSKLLGMQHTISSMLKGKGATAPIEETRDLLSCAIDHPTLFRYYQKLKRVLRQRIQEMQSYKALENEIANGLKEVLSIFSMINEVHNEESRAHLERVGLYSELLGHYYGLDKEDVQILKAASPMHDIGKIAIEDAILKKPGSLTSEEYEKMKMHTDFGYEILVHSQGSLFKAAATIAREHHEKFDGSGYPRGLKGDEISIFGRIVALADVFDALGSKRVYKRAWSNEEILAYLRKERGGHFDPVLIDLFLAHFDEFIKIKEVYSV